VEALPRNTTSRDGASCGIGFGCVYRRTRSSRKDRDIKQERQFVTGRARVLDVVRAECDVRRSMYASGGYVREHVCTGRRDDSSGQAERTKRKVDLRVYEK
jgi:hypothetical protein